MEKIAVTGKHVRSTPASRAMRRAFWAWLTPSQIRTIAQAATLFAILALSTLVEGITF